MARRRRSYDDDDGRTIADMTGVSRPGLLRQSGGQTTGRGTEADSGDEFFRKEEKDASIPPEERKWFILGALKAALLIALVFIAGLGLTIFLLLKLWGA